MDAQNTAAKNGGSQNQNAQNQRIGQVAAKAGVSPDTLRYYERMGLLSSIPRTDGGYRVYSEKTIERIQFIRNALRFGFGLKEVRTFMRASESGRAPCREVRSAAGEILTRVDRQIKELQVARRALRRAEPKVVPKAVLRPELRPELKAERRVVPSPARRAARKVLPRRAAARALRVRAAAKARRRRAAARAAARPKAALRKAAALRRAAPKAARRAGPARAEAAARARAAAPRAAAQRAAGAKEVARR